MNSGQFGQLLVASVAAALILGCNTARITDTKGLTRGPRPRPFTIYVANFDFDPKATSLLSTNPASKISDKQMAEFQEIMSLSLVDYLKKAGSQATRLDAEAPLPRSGWLVRGRFTSMDKGNVSMRALLGFGAGKENVRVVCTVERLSEGESEPLYEFHVEAGTRNFPGTIFMPLPTLIAARYASEEDSLEKDVEKTAVEIAARIQQQFQHGTRERSDMQASASNPSSAP